MIIEIYTDGSSDGRSGGIGGWGFVLVVDGQELEFASGSIEKATNNSAELTAAIEGMARVIELKKEEVYKDAEVILISDSQLVLGYASAAYRCKAPHLLPLYLKIRKLYKLSNATGKWIKGHSGHEHNEKCDQLAKSARNSRA